MTRISNNLSKTLLILALTTALLAPSTDAATVVQSGSGVQAYFGSQSNAYTASNPVVGGWGVPGFGTYPIGAVLPGLPPAPTSITFPIYTGNTFQGGGNISNFNDLAPGTTWTTANSVISDSFLPIAAQTEDANIIIPNWNLNQGATATGYAYEQLNFGAAYTVTNNPGGLAGSTPSLPLFINGSVQAGGYVQFDGVIRYDWIAVQADGTLSLTPISLGSLNYTFTQLGGGAYSATIPSVGALAATPILDGVLEITGHFWLAGDPFDATVTSLPEPASLGVIGLSAVAILSRPRR